MPTGCIDVLDLLRIQCPGVQSQVGHRSGEIALLAKADPKRPCVREVECAVLDKLRRRGHPAIDVQPQLLAVAHGRQVRPDATGNSPTHESVGVLCIPRNKEKFERVCFPLLDRAHGL